MGFLGPAFLPQPPAESEADCPAPADAPAPRFVRVEFVLGDGNVTSYCVQVGEVFRLQAPERLLDQLRAEHFIGFQVVEA